MGISETQLENEKHSHFYALIFLAVVLGLSVILERWYSDDKDKSPGTSFLLSQNDEFSIRA